MADFDQDGALDLYGSSSSKIGIQYGRMSDKLYAMPQYIADIYWSSLTTVDYDNDGWQDILAFGNGPIGQPSGLFLLRNEGASLEWSESLIAETPPSAEGTIGLGFDWLGPNTNLAYDVCVVQRTSTTNIFCHSIGSAQIDNVFSFEAPRVQSSDYVADGPLGEGYVFHRRIDTAGLVAPQTYWIGIDENGLFQEPITLMTDQHPVFVRDVYDDGEPELIFVAQNERDVYRRPILPENQEPANQLVFTTSFQIHSLIMLDSDGDGDQDFATVEQGSVVPDGEGIITLRINGGLQNDNTTINDTARFGLVNLSYTNQSQRLLKYPLDLDQDGREEIAAWKFLSNISLFSLEYEAGTVDYHSAWPTLNYYNVQPARPSSSSERQQFYYSGIHATHPAIFRINDEEVTGRFFPDTVLTVPVSERSSTYGDAQILSFNILPTTQTNFNGITYRLRNIFDDETLPSGIYLNEVSDNGVVNNQIHLNFPSSTDYEYLDFFGSGQQLLVHKNPFIVYVDENRDLIPEDTLLGPGGSSDDIYEFADFNADGKMDILFPDRSYSEILMQQSDSSFQLHYLDIEVETINNIYPQTLDRGPVVADINGDEFPDLLLPGSTGAAGINQGNLTFDFGRTPGLRSSFWGLLDYQRLDTDSDGDEDHLFYTNVGLRVYDSLSFCPNLLDCTPAQLELNFQDAETGNEMWLVAAPANRYTSVFETDFNDTRVMIHADQSLKYFELPFQPLQESPPQDTLATPPDLSTPNSTPFPNPTTDQLQFVCPNCQPGLPVVLRILTPGGNLLQTFPPQPIEGSWNVATLDPGTYFYRLTQAGEIVGSGIFFKQ